MKLTVRNIEQKIIFVCEMQGQISDGKWENASPFHHWEQWSDLDWNDVLIGKKIGVSGYLGTPKKYNFASKELLEIVGERILIKINLYHIMPKIIEPILKEDPWLIPDNRWIPTCSGEYWEKKRARLKALGITEEILEQASCGIYAHKDLVIDCTELKKAAQTKI